MKKEPIHYPWLWVGLVLITLFSVPWYFPKTAVEPILFGFPLWANVSIVMSLVLSAYLSFMMKKTWKDDEEEVDS